MSLDIVFNPLARVRIWLTLDLSAGYRQWLWYRRKETPARSRVAFVAQDPVLLPNGENPYYGDKPLLPSDAWRQVAVSRWKNSSVTSIARCVVFRDSDIQNTVSRLGKEEKIIRSNGFRFSFPCWAVTRSKRRLRIDSADLSCPPRGCELSPTRYLIIDQSIIGICRIEANDDKGACSRAPPRRTQRILWDFHSAIKNSSALYLLLMRRLLVPATAPAWYGVLPLGEQRIWELGYSVPLVYHRLVDILEPISGSRGIYWRFAMLDNTTVGSLLAYHGPTCGVIRWRSQEAVPGLNMSQETLWMIDNPCIKPMDCITEGPCAREKFAVLLLSLSVDSEMWRSLSDRVSWQRRTKASSGLEFGDGAVEGISCQSWATRASKRLDDQSITNFLRQWNLYVFFVGRLDFVCSRVLGAIVHLNIHRGGSCVCFMSSRRQVRLSLIWTFLVFPW